MANLEIIALDTSTPQLLAPQAGDGYKATFVWNNVATTYTGMLLDLTNTASAAGSKLLDMQVGGNSIFSVDPDTSSPGLTVSNASAATLFSVTDSTITGTRPFQLTTTANNSAITASNYSLTGTSTTPMVDLSGSWATTGTATLIKANLTADTGPSNAASQLMDLQVGGSSKFSVKKDGRVDALAFNLTGGTYGGDSNWWSANNLNIKSTTVLSFGSADLILARDAAGTLAQRNSTNAQTFRIYNTYTDSTNTFERGKIAWESNILRIGTEKGVTGGLARALELQTNGATRLTLGATGDLFTQASTSVYVHIRATASTSASLSCPADGVLLLTNWNINDFNRLQFGGTTSSFPSLKRSSTTLQVRLADDSAFAAIEALNLTNGRTMARFTPLDNQPPASNFATLDTRNSVAVLDFDAATDESAVFVAVIPQAATLTSGIKVRISWAATSATSGDCVWAAQFEKTTGQDIDSDSFDTATTATTTTSGTSGVVNTTEITCTTIDSLAAGDCYRLKIYRDADAGGDTMTGDAELVAVELQQVA